MKKLDYTSQDKWPRTSGNMQSPIALSDDLAVVNDFQTELSFDYDHTASYVRDTGAGIEVGLTGHALLGNRPFTLKQFHIHTPSEHTINAQSFSAEIHFVHEALDGRLAVVAVPVIIGQASDSYQIVLQHMNESIDCQLPLDDIMPKDTAYYHYIGSLTTPPLTENVEWYVLKNAVTLSEEQLSQLKVFYKKNNRDLQDRNDRTIITSN